MIGLNPLLKESDKLRRKDNLGNIIITTSSQGIELHQIFKIADLRKRSIKLM